MTLTREEILKNVHPSKIDDETHDRIKTYFPVSDPKSCPTCDGLRTYRIHGRVHDCDCQLQRALQKAYFAANIGREYHDLSLADFYGDDRDTVVPIVEGYLDSFENNFHYGLGLTLSGPFGTGKTLVVMHVLKELIKRGRSVYFVTFEDLINTWGASYKDNKSKELLERTLKGAEVLGLDEVKSDPRNNSGFLQNGFDSVVRHRVSNLLPTLITTNMVPIQEESEFGKVYSLLSSRNRRVVTVGSDMRQSKVREINRKLVENGERRPIV